jgi:hypothetical protein
LRTASATPRATGSGFLAIRSITILRNHDSHLAVKKAAAAPPRQPAAENNRN